MSKITEWMLFILGLLALACVNAIAFVFDGEWINVAMTLDATFIGALIAKYLKTNT